MQPPQSIVTGDAEQALGDGLKLDLLLRGENYRRPLEELVRWNHQPEMTMRGISWGKITVNYFGENLDR